ncbi:MAG: plastocyanin/azurin family copper-binding protein [Solirubrobacteraceae bacterium]
MFKQPALLLSAAALAVGVAACGGSSGSSSTAAGATSAGATSSAAGATSTSAAGTGTSAGATSSSAAAAGGSSHLAIAANPSGQLAYDKKTLSAKAGKVTIAMTNSSPVGHNITIQQGSSGSVLGATPTFQGGTKTVTVNLKKGTYTFFCSVPGHRAGGLVGTLTVS